MSQNRYEHLFARIYSHYQQLAQDALRFYPHTFERSDLPQEVSVLDSDPAHDLYGFMQI